MRPDDIRAYSIVRIADEIVIDLLGSACGVDFASINIEYGNIEEVQVPIADIDSLIKTKESLREKDVMDRKFLFMLKEERKNI